MDQKSSSWADQWDNGGDAEPLAESKKKATAAEAVKEGVKSGVEKTKAVASTGLKKVKEGGSHGWQWVKDKCHKKTQKQ